MKLICINFQEAEKKAAAEVEAKKKELLEKHAQKLAQNKLENELNNPAQSGDKSKGEGGLPESAGKGNANKKDGQPSEGQGGRSKKLAPSRFSYLSTAEQRMYVDLYQKYSKFIPQQPNKNEVKDIQKFKVGGFLLSKCYCSDA